MSPGLQEVIIRNFFIVLFTPLARCLHGWNPITITYIGLMSGCAAGLAFYLAHLHSTFYLVAGILVALSGTCDSLDGIVARMYHRTSLKGDFLDHFFDRVSDVAILLGLAYSPGARSALGNLCIILVLLNAYLGTQMEATFKKRYYGGIGKAEFFVGLVVLSLLLWLWPGPLFGASNATINLTNLFFMILVGLTLVSLTQRFRRLGQLLDEEKTRA